jgi:hypothetical protein
MQTMTRAVLTAGLLACVVMSALQAMASKPRKGPACSIVNGACVSLGCNGECGPLFPATCTCIGN